MALRCFDLWSCQTINERERPTHFLLCLFARLMPARHVVFAPRSTTRSTFEPSHERRQPRDGRACVRALDEGFRHIRPSRRSSVAASQAGDHAPGQVARADGGQGQGCLHRCVQQKVSGQRARGRRADALGQGPVAVHDQRHKTAAWDRHARLLIRGPWRGSRREPRQRRRPERRHQRDALQELRLPAGV